MERGGLSLNAVLISIAVIMVLAGAAAGGYFFYTSYYIDDDSLENNATAQQSSCILEDAIWQHPSVTQGENIDVMVTGNGCDNESVTFEIFRNDSSVVNGISGVLFEDDIALVSWKAGSSDPNDLFIPSGFFIPLLLASCVLLLYKRGHSHGFLYLIITMILIILILSAFILTRPGVYLSPGEYWFKASLESNYSEYLESGFLTVTSNESSSDGDSSSGSGSGGNGGSSSSSSSDDDGTGGDPTCSDGTLTETCSDEKPLYCDGSQNLIESCDVCGCDDGELCSGDETCAVLPENGTHGEQRTIGFIVSTSDYTPSEDFAEGLYQDMFGPFDSIDAIFRNNSFELAWLNGSVFGPYIIEEVADEICHSTDSMIRNAVPLADPEVNFSDYDIMLGVILGCPGGGGEAGEPITLETEEGNVSIGLGIVKTSNFGLTLSVATHELGHVFGLSHAQDLECGQDSFSDICDVIAYGDEFDIMGSGWIYDHFHAAHKERLGWFYENQIIESDEWGEYTLSRYETRSGVKALKVPVYDGFYYAEYREELVFDFDQGENRLSKGLLIHFVPVLDNLETTLLIDTSPHQGTQVADSHDSLLEVGETYYDFDREVYITTEGITDGELTLSLGLPSCGNGSIDSGEQCDGTNLGGNTCQSIGFRQGSSVSCDEQCQFETSSCSEPVCSPGHKYLGNNSCTFTFEPNSADGHIRISGENASELRHATSGHSVADDIATVAPLFQHNLETISLINRAAYSFDTQSIPDNAQIIGGTLMMYPVEDPRQQNSHPGSDDFVALIPVNLTSPPGLDIDDFGQFGSVTDPVELAPRIDKSELPDYTKVILPFNQAGIQYIDSRGFTQIGLRAGYDVTGTLPNQTLTDLLFLFNSADNIIRPKLNVTYYLPE